MSGRRDPDPTLTAYADTRWSQSVGWVRTWVLLSGGRDDGAAFAAHRRVESTTRVATACGVAAFGWPKLPTEEAAYIAVPCQRCFTDAPRPGCRFGVNPSSGEVSPTNDPDPHLAWQVPDREDADA